MKQAFCYSYVNFSDPITYKTFDGVEAGDIGAKCGWNGLDNGFDYREDSLFNLVQC